ncbi:hypothetical protein ACWEQV_28415 [Rhodococcus aetherivorans]|uniref:hypothetical protein n=1 Tax=Rhodococcus aetherivorans TaxID=191292 RepID=UPI000A485A88|nr:hypothetical protein [Rhodococcus aetherivorans]MDV6293944.1 hypothetical protein [Rhodococcus aetherivorans]
MPAGKKWCETESAFFPADEFDGDVHRPCQAGGWRIPDSYVVPPRADDDLH